MQSIDKYIAELKKELPDIDERLNVGVSEEQWNEFAGRVDGELPLELKQLYTKANGETADKDTGFLAGFYFLSLEGVLSEFECFKTIDSELMAMGTNAISEEAVSRLTWIPIAFDGSRGYLVIDLTPTKDGKIGQVITVDFDYDNCYKLADSLSEFFEKMTAWLRQGILIVCEKNEKKFISEKSGHLFNRLDDLTAKEADSEKYITLPEGYWAERYEKSAVKREAGSIQVEAGVLSKEKRVLIQRQHISCEIFAYMDNLKELILHNCEIENMKFIAKAPQLQTLIFAECKLMGEDFSVLSGAPKLKEISINVMDTAGIEALKDMKSLKRLSLRKVTGVSEDLLSGFVNLQELSLEALEIRDGSFLTNMKGLKKLELHRLKMNHLNFLSELKKLVEFELSVPALEESGLESVKNLVKLKSFLYPVKNLEIYKGHPSLRTVGFAADVNTGFEVFEGSHVESFSIIGSSSDRHLEAVRKKMQCYVRLVSYGSRG